MSRLLGIVLLFFAGWALNGSNTNGEHYPIVQKCRLESNLYIGMEVTALTAEEEQNQQKEEAKPPYGLIVTRVTPGSPAEKAGIKEGEILLKVNGGPLKSPLDLLAAVNRTQAGIPLHFRVWRETGSYSVPVPVAERPHPVIVGELEAQAQRTAISAKVNPLMDDVARLLSEETPNYPTLREKLLQVYDLEGNPEYPDCIRLYYETDRGYVYVTLTDKIITIEVHEGAELYSYNLKQQGDLIPPAVQHLFAQLL